MDFFEWWFTRHWIASTLITPGLTMAWAMYRDLDGRFWTALIVYLCSGASAGRKS